MLRAENCIKVLGHGDAWEAFVPQTWGHFTPLHMLQKGLERAMRTQQGGAKRSGNCCVHPVNLLSSWGPLLIQNDPASSSFTGFLLHHIQSASAAAGAALEICLFPFTSGKLLKGRIEVLGVPDAQVC